jgi:outer membrane biosynthesis protein TonB
MKGYLSSAVLVLPLLLSGCVHKTNQAQIQPPLAPPIEDAPLPKPDTAPANLPPPVISLPDKNPLPPAQTTTTPAPPPQPAKKKKQKPTTPPAQSPAQSPAPSAQTTEQASNNSPEVPATGNFSSGDSTNLKDETQNMINETDRGLTGINRKLNDQEAKTFAQIKEFLKQARAAMSSNDMFGAHNLAVKAHVLLVELTQ